MSKRGKGLDEEVWGVWGEVSDGSEWRWRSGRRKDGEEWGKVERKMEDKR